MTWRKKTLTMPSDTGIMLQGWCVASAVAAFPAHLHPLCLGGQLGFVRKKVAMKSVGHCVMVVFAVAVVGCYPVRGLTRYGLRGRAVERDTGTPVPNAEVVFRDQEHVVAETSTNREGRFHLRPDYSIYITWPLCGPILIPAFPTSITLRASGHPLGTFPVARPPTPADKVKPNALRPQRTSSNYLDFGDIQVDRR